MKTIVTVETLSGDNPFSFIVPNSRYQYDCGRNLNEDYLDELCDMIEERLPDNIPDYDNGYGYVLSQE